MATTAPVAAQSTLPGGQPHGPPLGWAQPPRPMLLAPQARQRAHRKHRRSSRTPSGQLLRAIASRQSVGRMKTRGHSAQPHARDPCTDAKEGPIASAQRRDTPQRRPQNHRVRPAAAMRPKGPQTALQECRCDLSRLTKAPRPQFSIHGCQFSGTGTPPCSRAGRSWAKTRAPNARYRLGKCDGPAEGNVDTHLIDLTNQTVDVPVGDPNRERDDGGPTASPVKDAGSRLLVLRRQVNSGCSHGASLPASRNPRRNSRTVATASWRSRAFSSSSPGATRNDA